MKDRDDCIAMQCIAGSLFHRLVSNSSFVAEIPMSPPDPTGGQILGSDVSMPRVALHPVAVLQLYTCGIPSTIKAIMRASLWIGSAGPGACSKPGIPMG
jgi:hypothetical protein